MSLFSPQDGESPGGSVGETPDVSPRKTPFHLFSGVHAPLLTLSGIGLLIMASSRTAYAILVLAALLWVYLLSVLAVGFSWPILPGRGRGMVIILISTVLDSLFLLIVSLSNPLLAMEITLLILLVPVYAASSELIPRVASLHMKEALGRAFSEAFVFGLLIFALALIREPLAYGSLSVPGGPLGIRELFSSGDGEFFPVRIAGSAAGAFLLLGYGIACFRRFRPPEERL
ncbi:hypothetical protein FACS189493_0780 [Spirochaetia bacterium]|nr:hypothetical protein FACS189493_0780 [Spirochaetia bacterium]